MSYIGAQPTTAAFVTDTFSANGSGTVFTLSVAPANTNSILVAVSGVLQDPSTYSVSGTTLTFSAAPPAGTSNISVRFLGIPASGVTTTAYRTVTEFTATAGQTTFSVPSYTPGFIDVYRNGVMLGSTNYTASNGTTVVLGNAASVGDLVEVISFSVSSVLNAIPAVAGAVNSTYLLDGAVTQSKLGTGVAGNGPAFSAFAANDQSITNNVFTKVQINSETFDTNSCFDSTTNYRFTPNVAGYYQVNGAVKTTADNGSFSVIYKNGSILNYGSGGNSGLNIGGVFNGSVISQLVYLNGSTDYIELYVISGNNTSVKGSSTQTYFSASLVRGA